MANILYVSIGLRGSRRPSRLQFLYRPNTAGMVFKQYISYISTKEPHRQLILNEQRLARESSWPPEYPEHKAQIAMPEQTTFEFKSTSMMLDTLAKLPKDDIKKIRNIRVKGFPILLSHLDCYPIFYNPHYIHEALNMLPGLQLDRLTVLDCFHELHQPLVNDGWGDVGTYSTIEGLLITDGWKELHFITPTTEFIAGEFDEDNRRVAQPVAWNKAIRERDGRASGAEVKMYIAKTAGVAGLAENPKTRVPWKCRPGHLRKRETLDTHKPRDERPCDDREVLLVAKRGIGANYVQDGSQLDGNIKELLREFGTWEKIRRSENYERR